MWCLNGVDIVELAIWSTLVADVRVVVAMSDVREGEFSFGSATDAQGVIWEWVNFATDAQGVEVDLTGSRRI